MIPPVGQLHTCQSVRACRSFLGLHAALSQRNSAAASHKKVEYARPPACLLPGRRARAPTQDHNHRIRTGAGALSDTAATRAPKRTPRSCLSVSSCHQSQTKLWRDVTQPTLPAASVSLLFFCSSIKSGML